MDGSVLDILIYVFDHYMLDDQPDVPERDELAQDLTRAGFASDNVERALDWLADLAGDRDRPSIDVSERSLRVFSESEAMRLDAEARGCLLTLERSGILSPLQREIVVERLLALEVEELGIDQVKWVALMVLSSQPGQEMACARMQDIVFEEPSRSLH